MSREVKFSPRIFIIAAAAVALAFLTTIIIINLIPKETEFPVSELEKLALIERSEKYTTFLEEIDQNKEFDENAAHNPVVADFPLDRYIAYALEYNYNFEDKTELTAKNIKKFLESVFDTTFDEEALNGVGISPYLLDKSIGHDPVSRIYYIHKDFDKRQIANIPVVKYIRKNIYTNEDKSIYTIVYDKYNAKSPYDVLPHLDGATGTKDYLEGKGKITSLKDAIDEKAAKAITAPEKETTVEYILKDGKLVIKSIK